MKKARLRLGDMPCFFFGLFTEGVPNDLLCFYNIIMQDNCNMSYIIKNVRQM